MRVLSASLKLAPERRAIVDSLFFKAAGLTVLCTLVVAATISTFSALHERRVILEDQRILLATLADGTLNTVARPVQFGDAARTAEALDALMAHAPDAILGAAIVAASGEELARTTEGTAEGAQLARARALESLAAGAPSVSRDGLDIGLPVTKPDGTVIGALGIHASAHARLADARLYLMLTLFAGFVVLVAASGVSIWLLRRMISLPLLSLTSVLSEMTAGRYDQNIPLADRKDEIGVIGRSLQALAAELMRGREAEAARLRRAEEQSQVTAILGEALLAIADGKLTHDLEEPFPEEYETLRENFNRVVANMRAAMSQVAETSDRIRLGADEMTRASDDLARRTEQQAATLEQTAASLDVLSGSIRATADGAHDLTETVREANTLVDENSEVMRKAVEAMSSIEKSSSRIGEIVDMIDEIAFQTNILALNAGVEAARAGEAGRGFAVVASEVRGLAERASDAARQIGQLVDAASQEVRAGVQLVEKSGGTLDSVVEKVSAILELIGNITTGAEDQANGVVEINSAMSELDRVTQQNAAMAEEASAATQMLFGDTARLTELVSAFQIDTAARAARRTLAA